mgnify:CR=1 FL=1
MDDIHNACRRDYNENKVKHHIISWGLSLISIQTQNYQITYVQDREIHPKKIQTNVKYSFSVHKDKE